MLHVEQQLHAPVINTPAHLVTRSAGSKRSFTRRLSWLLSGVGLLLYAIALIAGQIFYWLKTGEWLPIPFAIVFMQQFAGGSAAWHAVCGEIVTRQSARLLVLWTLISWLNLTRCGIGLTLSLAAFAVWPVSAYFMFRSIRSGI